MNKIFLDTGWFKAELDERDGHHLRAKNIFRRIKKERLVMVTTNFVLDESFTLIKDKCGVFRAKRLFGFLTKFPEKFGIERVTLEDERRVWDWFWHDWRELSYTDCTSFAVMERLGIEKVATFDEHFETAGFEVVK
ncbi:hypothetical protein A2634_01340 [Candidatus Amesbacteria bacterium RIFCSPHIGHO2_01_FULL_48_32]|uniref:PIN domain-containing protein n=1 Tax=Candidatus Amesbacteria bacterium RIFCSPLOWO2_01_FULL_48_25 TaxID=1797259 RepID=A0A1F4ZCN5_9BACT|nr:MAG: hypothetical protein A2634_01340 [Candidatus Amesbacteria bacterium RIFCSPHIGHO2_01_FULL_48_32]OGD03686.1 MAG: hypothetical protein A2989_03325 [Candidatus Amesbacteria bacterium RIFCSPLOWO2_01_FULL_48_25]HJZ05965.1 PIN domain-containing protein [Patescibacteria group bacterium]